MRKIGHSLGMKMTALLLLPVFALGAVASVLGIALLVESEVYVDGGKTLRDIVMSELVQRDVWQADEDTWNMRDLTPEEMQEYLTQLYDETRTNFRVQLEYPDGTVISSGDMTGAEYLTPFELYPRPVGHTMSVTREFDTEEEMHAFLDEMHEKYYVLGLNTYPEWRMDPLPTPTPAPQPTGNAYDVIYDSTDQADVAVPDEQLVHVAHVSYAEKGVAEYTLTGAVAPELTAMDKYYYADLAVTALVGAQNWLIVIAALCLILAISDFIYLICAAGHKNGVEGAHLNWIDKIPFDLYLCVLALGAFLAVQFAHEGWYYSYELIIELLALGCGAAALYAMGMSFLLTFAARAKAGTLWRNTVVGYVIRFLWAAVRCLPLAWKAALGYIILLMLEFFGILITQWEVEILLALWFLESAVLGFCLLIIVSAMHRIKKGGEKIAAGDFAAKIDTRYMPKDFREHAENITRIQAGLKKAVDEGVKSERMKAELITNVSHDIKTPLTSIVNYVDLLKKEDVQPEKAREYVEVLDRQSERLKKLTEDLVEASKASTGNVAVHPDRTDVNVLIGQVLGEYEERIEAKNLEVVANLAPENPAIYTDGRLMWRVFGNLMSNIVKYALPGTRVYIGSEVAGGKVIMTFRNISALPLNIPAEELMERFVRGDASRSTEGSGLGLSIAQSLTELMGGAFGVKTDGDLFKVTVSFPVYKK